MGSRLRVQLLIVRVLSSVIIFTTLAAAGSPTTNPTERTGLELEDAPETRNRTLELVHVVMRHGARTPVNTYPKDPYVTSTFFPYGWGHLTNDAKRDLFDIGRFLRKRYRSILGPYYQNDVIHAQSTASPRTLMSLSVVLAAMFPPKLTPMDWKFGYNWQPVPVYSEPFETDIKLRMTATCPRYDEALQEVLQLPEVQAELREHEPLFRELSELTGMNVTSANDINSIYITLLAEQGYGVVLPPWTKDYFPKKMQFMAEQNYVYLTYTDEMKRIKGGPFLQQWISDMQSKVAGTLAPPGRNMYIYCAHDWSITNILRALNVWERQMPFFSAFFALELYKNNETGEYYVEIYLKNGVGKQVMKLTVPGCSFQCPLTKLVELSSKVLPDGTYGEMCRPKAAPV